MTSTRESVSTLLKKHYPNSSETKPLRIGRNTKVITNVVQDPLLWIRVTYEETAINRFTPLDVIAHLKFDSFQDSKVKELIERRLQVLDAAIPDLVQQGGDLFKLAGESVGAGKRAKTIFATAQRKSRIIRSCTINGIPDKCQAETDDDSSSQRRGVVVDMYPSGEQCEGYVVSKYCESAGGHSCMEVHKFEVAAIKAADRTILSIGDVVTFRANDHRVVNSSLCVAEYFPGVLNEEFVRDFLKELVASISTSDLLDAKPESLVSRVLEASALWKGLLNEGRLYQQLYKEVLSICFACIPDCGASPKHVEFLNMFRDCSFIRHIPKILQQDHRQNYNQGSNEFQSFRQEVQTTSHLLKYTVSCLPCEKSYTLAEVLKCLIELLSKQELSLEEEIKFLAYSVLDNCTTAVSSAANCLANHKQANAVNATTATEQLLPQDPLFWLQLLYGSKAIEKSLPVQLLRGNQLTRAENIVEKHKQALKWTEDKYNQDLSALVKRYENQFFLREVHLQNSLDIDEEESCGPTQQGVVSDLYPTCSGNHWEGYVVSSVQSIQAENESAHMFRFDSNTTANSNHACNLPIHIGDVVTFRPCKAITANAFQVANATLQVVEYFPGVLKETTVLPHLDRIKQASDNIETLHEIVQYLAVWKYILNEPLIYQKYYQVILGIYKAAHTDATTTNSHLKLIHTFKGSSFIQELVALLEGDTRQQSDDYQKDVCVSTELLLAFAQCFPNKAHTILKQLVELLSRLKMYKQLHSLVPAIIDSCLVPPDSVRIQDMPRKWIPTVPTKQEFEESIRLKASSSPDLNLPMVKVHGCYESPEEYGRTYFDLLRADCYRELVKTVTHLKTQHTHECRSCTSYYLTLIFLGLTQGTGHKIVYNLQFEAKLPCMEGADSSHDSQFLKQGNLVCLSIGGKFKNDIVWAVIDRSQQTSSNSSGNTICKVGEMQVELCSEANEFPDEKVMELFKQSKNVVAVESPAYFRAYQPVLEALRTLDINKIHFINDLLDPSFDIKSGLEIINDSSEVDALHLYLPGKQPDEPRVSVMELKKALASDNKDKFCLDESQRKAVCKALSHPLSVIQGPPGTGKTYIALKLLQLFLSLSTLPRDKPIIIMAYKNRALDHILKECMQFCPNQQMVRIGHVSEGYEHHLEEMTLCSRQKAQYGGTGQYFIRQFRRLYTRVRKASEQVEKRSRLSLENCLPAMSPQWLRSLLLETKQELVLSEDLKQKIDKDPHKYLCLLKEHTIMGKQDRDEKRELEQALTTAWNLWAKHSVDSKLSPKIMHKHLPSHMSDSEVEEDSETIEEDRHMATNDDTNDESAVLKCDIELSRSILDTMAQDSVGVDDNHVWGLNPEQIQQLIVNTVRVRYNIEMEYLKDCLRDYNEVHEKYELERQQQHLEVLKRAQVVGMTTTGAAIHQELLNKLKAPVVFVEEAAEVLESNLLATLTPHVKHLVLIGDHYQLKPQVHSHKLATDHKFNTSMFERLVKNKFPYTLLMQQSRMHPLLVTLFSYHYIEQRKEAGQIMSSKGVHDYQHPSCMASPIFWWSYSGIYEEKCGQSFTNPYEAEMVAALCLWLLSQHTKAKQIQVLTPYRAQLKLTSERLRSVVPKAEIKVSTVDEFQGHESDIIILCLVRSNHKKQTGFLREKSRLVVGTSRQKRGLYIIGNAKFLKEASPVLWKPFIERLEKKDPMVGDAIPIKFNRKQYDCHSPEQLRRASCNPESLSCMQDAEDHQQPDEMASDSPMKGSSPSSSAGTTPLNPGSQAMAPPLRQQSSPAALNFSQTDARFQRCILDLQKTPAVKNRKNIARRLGVINQDIDGIEEVYRNDPNEAFYQVMQKWHQQDGKEATPQKLIDALNEEDLNNVAQIVKNRPLEW